MHHALENNHPRFPPRFDTRLNGSMGYMISVMKTD